MIDPATGEMKTHDLGEVVQNSFAVGDKGDVYIVSEAALYRFQADASGAPVVKWRKVYENTGEQKPGQVSAGSGTTPTLHGDHWVSITDNADPMNVVVYRRGGGREICRQPVFEEGAGSTDNSLIGAGHSIVVENNHGYTGPTATTHGQPHRSRASSAWTSTPTAWAAGASGTPTRSRRRSCRSSRSRTASSTSTRRTPRATPTIRGS